MLIQTWFYGVAYTYLISYHSDAYFGMYINHGGEFRRCEDSTFYIGGCLVPRLDLEVDRFGYLDLEDEIEKLGYSSWKSISYKLPDTFKYVVLKDDRDVMQMLSLLGENSRILHIFVDSGKKLGNGDNEAELGGYEGDGDRGEHEKDMQDETVSSANLMDAVIEDGSVSIPLDSDDSADDDYIPSDNENYTDDSMDDDELLSDAEYIDARRTLREKSEKSLCDEVLGTVGGEGGISEYEDSDGDVDSSETDEESETRKDKMRKNVYDPTIDHKHLQLAVGMRFEDGFQAKDAIKEHAIEDGRGIHFRRVSTHQMEAYCNPPCKWRCYGSKTSSSQYFSIKVINAPHTCSAATKNNQVTSTWIANKYLNVFRYRPELTVKELKQDIVRRYNVSLLCWKLYKAKEKAIEMLRGSVDEHYAKLRSYILELKRTDNEGRFDLWVDAGAVFKGIYIGFSGLRNGFRGGCRRVIGLDGAFLKTYLGGVLLSAVATDANNQMYPIAWAVVKVENYENWTWFIQILMEELELSTGAGTTFISDQQKVCYLSLPLLYYDILLSIVVIYYYLLLQGLLNAVAELAPMAVHRNCARHVFINWKKTNKGIVLKNLFWRIVRSTHMADFNKNLDALKAKDVSAYEDFIGRDITKFCKVFIDPSSVSDMVLNNTTESFNGYILNARGKHVIHMLEEIRTSLMVRQHRKMETLNGFQHRICPEIWEKVEKLKHYSRYCVPYPSSDVLFEVENYGDRFVVDIQARTCSCRGWDITGIPCIHACSALNLLRRDASDYCHDCYSVEKFKEAYKYGLAPINGERMWPPAEGYPVVPPEAKKMPGRPKKKRKRNPCEENPNPSRMRKTGVIMTCQNCFQEGHNKRSCKNPPSGSRSQTEKVSSIENSSYL